MSDAEPITGITDDNDEYHIYSHCLKTPINTTYQHVCSKKNFHGCYFKIDNIELSSPIENYLSKYRGSEIAGPGRIYLLAMKIAYSKYIEILKSSGFDAYGATFLITPEPMLDSMLVCLRQMKDRKIESDFFDLLAERTVMDKCATHILFVMFHFNEKQQRFYTYSKRYYFSIENTRTFLNFNYGPTLMNQFCSDLIRLSTKLVSFPRWIEVVIFCAIGCHGMYSTVHKLVEFLIEHRCSVDFSFLTEALLTYRNMFMSILAKHGLKDFLEELIVFLYKAGEMRCFYMGNDLKKELFSE